MAADVRREGCITALRLLLQIAPDTRRIGRTSKIQNSSSKLARISEWDKPMVVSGGREHQAVVRRIPDEQEMAQHMPIKRRTRDGFV